MRTLVTAVAAVLLTAATAGAQDVQGARRFEVAAFPGGAIVFGENADEDGPNFGDYALGASFAYNYNRWIGFEGELGGGIGFRQDLEFNDRTLVDQQTPHMLAYNGSVIVHVVGKDRVVAPYAAGGVGGLTLFGGDEVADLGVSADTTYFTGNIGGGVKWFPMTHLGVRGDGRFIAIKNKDSVPLFGQQNNRYGFRVYGGLVFTY